MHTIPVLSMATDHWLSRGQLRPSCLFEVFESQTSLEARVLDDLAVEDRLFVPRYHSKKENICCKRDTLE